MYHVIVKLNGEEEKRVLFKDLDEKDVKNKLVKPYKKGNKFFIDGEILVPSEIKYLKIVETNDCLDDELEAERKRQERRIDEMAASSGLFIIGGNSIYDWEIEDIGQDVTDKFIKKVSGKGTVVTRFLNNSWIISVVGGIILIFISYFIKSLLSKS